MIKRIGIVCMRLIRIACLVSACVCLVYVHEFILRCDIKGSTWVKNEVRHDHFKSCGSPMWPFIKTVESDVKVTRSYKK